MQGMQANVFVGTSLIIFFYPNRSLVRFFCGCFCNYLIISSIVFSNDRHLKIDFINNHCQCFTDLTTNHFTSIDWFGFNIYNDSLIIDSKGGCDVLVHHFETVEGFTPNSSANHLLDFFFSISTVFNRLNIHIILLSAKIMINSHFYSYIYFFNVVFAFYFKGILYYSTINDMSNKPFQHPNLLQKSVLNQSSTRGIIGDFPLQWEVVEGFFHVFWLPTYHSFYNVIS